jgi:hypothetical protein
MNLATVAPTSTRESNAMMQDMMGLGGMWGMGLIGLLVVLVLVLAAAWSSANEPRIPIRDAV